MPACQTLSTICSKAVVFLSSGLGIDVTYAGNVDIQVLKRLFLQQFQKESAYTAASDNGQIQPHLSKFGFI